MVIMFKILNKGVKLLLNYNNFYGVCFLLGHSVVVVAVAIIVLIVVR